MPYLSRCKNTIIWGKYKEAKKETKKVVIKASNKAFNELYQTLDTKEGEKTIHRLAKGRGKDIGPNEV